MKARIKLYTERSGGRHCMPEGSGYSPYLLFDGSDSVHGVRFLYTPIDAVLGQEYDQEMEFLYDMPEHEQLKKGAAFKILEGPKVIGKGLVLET